MSKRGTNEPFYSEKKTTSLLWKNLTVSALRVENNLFEKNNYIHNEIIHNVSGIVESGNLVAILGSSGSGKSTMMEALAHRNQKYFQNSKHGSIYCIYEHNILVKGEITVLGKPADKYMKEISGFIYQHDLFLPALTVKEHLMFNAKLKHGLGTQTEVLENMINELLSEMGLITIRDKVIGTSFLEKEEIHLSGGEQKRLSVATELLTNPSLLFCDEPTTGLDSFSALKLVTILKNLAVKHNKTIICSIHQPNPQVFSLFHQVILLSRGKIVFMGYEYTDDQNPAEFLVKSVSCGTEGEIDNLSRSFQNSKFFEHIKSNISQQEINVVPASNLVATLSFSWLYKLYLLTYRNFLCNSRDLSVQYLRIFQQLLLSIIIGLCMRGAINMTQSSIQAVFGFVFMIAYENSFPSMSGSITLIPKKNNLFFREYSNGINSPSKFLLSNIISLAPGLIIEAVLFTITLYWVVAYQQTFEVIFQTCMVAVLLIFTSSAFGMFTSVLFKTTAVAVICAVPIFNAFILCAGFYIRLNALPIYGVWIKNISWLAYATELFFILQWSDVSYIQCPSNPNLPCLHDGNEVLESYYYYKENFWFDVYVLIFMYTAFNVASYICLVYRIKNK